MRDLAATLRRRISRFHKKKRRRRNHHCWPSMATPATLHPTMAPCNVTAVGWAYLHLGVTWCGLYTRDADAERSFARRVNCDVSREAASPQGILQQLTNYDSQAVYGDRSISQAVLAGLGCRKHRMWLRCD